MARVAEQSSSRVRVSPRQKAPRSLRRCGLSRGRIRGRSRPLVLLPGHPGLVVTRAGDPGARCAARRANAIMIRHGPRSTFSRSHRPVAQLARASGTRRAMSRRVGAAARRSTAWQRARMTNAADTAGCRQAARAKAPARARGSVARRVCPCVDVVAEVDERRRGSRGALPWQRGAKTGSSPGRPQGVTGTKGADNLGARWQSRAAGAASAERSRGRRGQRLSSDGRHSGPSHRPVPFTRAWQGRPWPVSVSAGVQRPSQLPGTATGMSEVRSRVP